MALNKILNSDHDDLVKLQNFVYIDRYYQNLKSDHVWAIHNEKNASYEIEDIVSIRSHPLSAAGYGLTAKFMARYKGQYIVTNQLCENTYFLKDVSDSQVTPIIANIRQMKLL